MVTSGLPLPFSVTAGSSAARTQSKSGRKRAVLTSPTEGVIHQLLGDYAI